MLTYDPERARAALEFLIKCEALPQYVKGLRTTVKRQRALPYRDAAEPLNELVLIGRENPQALENLIALAQYKKGNHNDYQREYMSARRKRETMVRALVRKKAGRALTKDEQYAGEQQIFEKLNAEREDYIKTREAEYVVEHDEVPSWQAKNAFIAEFWAKIDAELAAVLAEMDRVLPEDKVVRRKRVVLVEPRPTKPTAMSEAFKKYLDPGRK